MHVEKVSYDVVVIGAGLAGLMVAHEIASAGYNVAVISKFFLQDLTHQLPREE